MNPLAKLLHLFLISFTAVFLLQFVFFAPPVESAPPPAMHVSLTWDTASNIRFWLADNLGHSTQDLPYFDPCLEWWCSTPIPNGQYDVYDYNGYGPSAYTLVTASPDAEYRIFLWHPEAQQAPSQINAHIQVEVNGILVVNTDLYVVDNDGQAEISSFVPLSTITGHIRDSNQNPIADVSITDDSGQIVKTDADGAYTLTRTTGGVYAISHQVDPIWSDYYIGVTAAYTITPTKENYIFAPQSRKVVIPPKGSNEDFVGQKGFTISGHVTDANHNPVPNVTISDGVGHSGKTDKLGGYEITGIFTGTYTLTPVKGSLTFTPAAHTIDISADVTDADFTVPDSDGDGLSDDWESYGVNIPDPSHNNDIFIDLPAMGAKPQHKDLFVHADWMPGYKPTPYAMQIVTEAFRDAPVSNPDNLQGISLHVDIGPTSIMDYRTYQTWGDLSKAGMLPLQSVVGTFDALRNRLDWSAIDSGIKQNFFNPSERTGLFHYACFCSNLPPEFFDATGVSRDNGSTDFLVTLGSLGGGTPLQQAGTFMHELGHNLGLHHGGDDDILFKPNYLSVMNYDFSLIGLLNQNETRSFDYSRRKLMPLNEDDLDEKVGISDPDKHDTLFDRSDTSSCL